MKRHLLVLFTAMAALSFQSLIAQEGDDAHRNFSVVTQQEATYPGGNEALYRFLFEKMQYPQAAKENKTQGDVQVAFYVEADSSVSDVRALNDPGDGLAEEAERLVKLLKFSPAIQNGKAVRSQMILPILFRL